MQELYPRPALRREKWQSLDGMWRCAFSDIPAQPDVFDRQIRVPYSPEAPLSGVQRQLKPGEWLHYLRAFSVERAAEERTLLHFGAVDYFCIVRINGQEVGRHRGGYLPFTLDITEWLTEGENILHVAVQDPSDTGHQARGKQKLKRGGMYYTAQSGLWQTVWLECVPDSHVERLTITPCLAGSCVRVEASVAGGEWGGHVSVLADGKMVCESKIDAENAVTLTIPPEALHMWTPDDPFLYDLHVTLPSGDHVESYFAMREFGKMRDKQGVWRFSLNGKPIFLNGLLDQGYWPEGLYTPPSEEAMERDIRTAKAMGFNLLRKHVKVEPQRWYYLCDRLGMIVWQDMPNGGGRYNAWFVTYAINIFQPILRRFPDRFYRLFARTDAAERTRYYEELAEMVEKLGNHPCIAAFVPFNEGWGQFDAGKATELVRAHDPQKRPVDEASGWFDQGGGDVDSIHNYFYPLKVRPSKSRVVALTEYGGIAWPCPGHRNTEGSYGYGTAKTQEELAGRYEKLVRQTVLPQIERGLSGLVYTQLSDVEDEINGVLTYDRQVEKLPRSTALSCANALYAEFARCTAEN